MNLAPKTEYFRTKRVTFRLTMDEEIMLRDLSDRYKMNRSDILRAMIHDSHDKVFNNPNKRWEVQK